ncbi:MAG: hypothetical protein KAH01_01445, partial [Caldisericia bacterium]|nr:hypothetical protein [Caldisericia bacterium]
TRYGTRQWQIGWADMVDYPPKRKIYDPNPAYENRPNDENAVAFDPTIVEAYQWDVGFELVNFRTEDNDRYEPNFTEERYHEPMLRTRDGHYDPYEYIYRKGCNNREVLPDDCLIDGVIHEENTINPYYIPTWTPVFYSNIEPLVVQVGDTRLVPMSYVSWDGSEVKNYEANTVVKPDDLDAPYDYDGNGILEQDERKYLSGFATNMKHTETIRDGINLNDPADLTNIYFDSMYRYSYFNTEFIYLDRDEDASDGVDPNGDSEVSIANPETGTYPDLRYSPVNTKLDIDDKRPTLLNGTEPYTNDDFDRKTISPASNQFGNYRNQDRNRRGMGLVGWDAITKTQGDVLILSEILKGGCESPTYDLSVETDVWMGTDVDIATGDINLMPSPAAARLRSPNGDITANSQRIQKNTVLAPDGQSFFIPATTFQNIKLDYREYIGVEIFKDNGIDNHIGINLGHDELYQQNLTDDFKEERCGEEFVGVVNGVNAKDNNNALIPMSIEPLPNDISITHFEFSTTDVLYYDTDNGTVQDQGPFVYGCGEPIYQNKNTTLAMGITDPTAYDPISTPHIVNEGDVRINGVHVIVNNNEIQYEAGTIVSEGDADVGFPLRYFNKFDFAVDEWDIRYFFNDEANPDEDIDPNDWYDLGEALYRSLDSATVPMPMYNEMQPHYHAVMLDVSGVYNSIVVKSNMTRMVEVTINGTTYDCGSNVSTGDFWYYQNPIHKISTGFNCDFRYIDEP